MPFTTIKKPSDYFNTKLYTGNGGTQSITGVGFQPDWTWIKERSSTSDNCLYDAVRGVTKRLESNTSDPEATAANQLNAFGTDGFTTGDSGATNENSQTYASWNWLANGAGSANTDGSISSTVSVNTTSGFSIVKYTGNSSAGATIGHGLGVVPNVIIAKKLNNTSNWSVYHSGLGNFAKVLSLNTTSAATTDSGVWDNVPTSSTFLVGSDNTTNANGDDYIAYCFAEKQGFSKFGSYVGNGNADGTFVYTGFKPAFVFVKRTDGIDNWFINDNKRNPFNEAENPLRPNINTEEYSGTGYGIDMLSNGFKVRTADAGFNASGGNYIYMCFAEEPLVGDNPATAR